MANLSKLVEKCMDSTYYCSLATSESSAAWVSPVAFAYDSDFNLYFVSSMASRHMRNIMRNPRVAVAIYTTAQKVSGSKVGVQLEGRAEAVKGPMNMLRAYKIYFGRLIKWEGATLDYFKKRNAEWRFFKISTTKLFYFNNGLYGEERQRVK